MGDGKLLKRISLRGDARRSLVSHTKKDCKFLDCEFLEGMEEMFMSMKYRLVSFIGLALFCTVAFFGLSAEAFATPNQNTTHPTVANHAAPKRSCPADLAPGKQADKQGYTVKQLQTALKNHGFKDAHGHTLAINGKYDSNTLFAVKRFEAQHHLPQNGKIDARQWQLLGVCDR
jgi:Putative peptidoglycan binding domain